MTEKVSIRRRILNKGELIKEQFIRTLQDHEDRIAAVESGEAGETADITALQTTVGDEDGGLRDHRGRLWRRPWCREVP